MSKKTLDITGQALIEGVMIKHDGQYAMALRKGNSDIEIIHDMYKGILGRGPFKKIPILRGIFALIDFLILGIKTFLFSSDYHEDNGDEEPQGFQRITQKLFGKYNENVEMAIFITLALIISVLGFVVLPFYISGIIADKVLPDFTKMVLIETMLRMVMVALYVIIFFLNKDIRRMCCYHGAQHKVINCLKKHDELTIRNVKRCSKYDNGCEFNFILSVIIVSVICFSFVKSNDMAIRMAVRVLVIPAVAAVIYEIMLLLNKIDNAVTNVLLIPQRLLQKLCVLEPTEDMIEVAIESVTAAFDWREYLGLEPLAEDENYSEYNYEDNVSKRADFTVDSSMSQMLYDDNLNQKYRSVNNENLGYTDVNKDFYSNDSFNYNVPNYDHTHYDYSNQYIIDSENKENSAYKSVVDHEITKQPNKEYKNDYTNVSYDELYNSFTADQSMSQGYNDDYSSMNNNYYGGQYDNYGGHNYQGSNFDPSYGYTSDGQMLNGNYVEDNGELSSLDRYFSDDNY